MITNRRALRVRWLGQVHYSDAHALQRGLFEYGSDDYLLLLEHPHVYTLGVRADPRHVLIPPEQVGAELVTADRGGDVTYHGPGQLVGYPIRTVPGKRGGGMVDTVAYVRGVEQLLIDVVRDLGLGDVGRVAGHPGVWVDLGSAHPRKLAAVGVRLSRGRSMHGFALNVAPDLGYFDHIVPCGIGDRSVTSLVAEGLDVTMQAVVDAVATAAARDWVPPDGAVDRSDVAWRVRPDDLSPFSRGAGRGDVSRPVRLLGRLAEAGVGSGLGLDERRPDWMRASLRIGDEHLQLQRLLRGLELPTVCEEAGCPNLAECWHNGTATFMINGDRCTRACGFCLVDSSRPGAVDPEEPARLAEAVEQMGLEFTVITAVARDDLDDGGAAGFAACIEKVRRRTPATRIEVLIPDCKGDPDALQVIFDARPDVLNHNIETVPRLQRAVRPQASYARSLAVLARAKGEGLVTKSGLIVGMGESTEEVLATFADLRDVGVDIVTVGQYLRPTTSHQPVSRWWTPVEFDELRARGEAMGIGHVEASPLTRSSYHARQAAEAS